MLQSIHKKIAAIAVTVLVLITGAAFLFAVLHLYFTGDAKPYSRELVGKYLVYLTIPSVLTLLAVIYSGILSLLSPKDEELAHVSLAKIALIRISAKLALEKCEEKSKTEILSERKKRNGYLIASISLIAAYIVISLIFALNFSHYTIEEHNTDIIALLVIILPATALVIGVITVFSYLFEASYKKELALAKEAIKAGAVKSPEEADEDKKESPIVAFYEKNENTIILTSRITAFAVAALLIILGIFNGGMADVIGKAVRICTECIGLG